MEQASKSEHSGLLNETLFTSLAHARKALVTAMDDYNPASQHPSVYVVEENRFC